MRNLAAALLDEVVGLGREPDQHLAGALSRPRSTRKSWVGSSTISGMPSCFLSLRSGGSLGRKSATAAAITMTSLPSARAEHGVLHLRRGLHRHDLDARAARDARWW